MGKLDDAPLVMCESREEWRAWLEANHSSAGSCWLVTWRKDSGRPVLPYEAAIEEALCVGWVDSTGGRLDDQRSKLYFAVRKPGSVWAATNKARVARLEAEGRMLPAGLAAIERAKADGSWTVLDESENLVVPVDLAAALDAHPPAAERFAAFPPSARKMIIAWVTTAKRPETRAARIAEASALAARNERAPQPRPRP
jgi:uncharacterized protein YdeI (YjbR/CyaY-like superfamily)